MLWAKAVTLRLVTTSSIRTNDETILHIQLVRNGFAVFVLDLDRDIDIFRLPVLKAVVILAEIKCHFADLDSYVVLEVRGSNFALEVDILVLDCDGHVLDGDIDGGFIERFDWCS